MPTLIIGAAPLTLAQLRAVYERPATIEIAPQAMAAVETGARTIADIVARGEVVYGVNTGFGLLANTRIAAEDLETLQRNLVLSHACGYGPPLSEGLVRLIMVLKLASLVRGASGVKVSTVEALRSLLNHQVYPVIPAKGSVGASGDLAPLAHMSCVLIGEGWAAHDGITLEGWKALALAGLAPLALGPKEGLALLNGTQVSTALALAGLFAAESAFAGGVAAGALSVDALKGSDTPFDPRIHALRGQPGQIDVAMALRTLLANSPIRESHRNDCAKVQDPYSLRCQPQVMGAVLDLLRQSARTLQTEANAVSDNPLVFPETGEVLSGGNFHAEPVAFAADQIAMALCEIGNISERRTAILVDPKMSELPAFLVRQSGLNSGFMIAQVTAAALASENKMLAHPASVDSIPTSANQEDHVSMACHGARRLLEMADNAQAIVGIELLAAAQGLEFHRPMTSSHALESSVADIREQVPGYERDRYFADDIEAAQAQVRLGFFRHYVRGLLPSDDGGLDERRDVFRLSFRGGPLIVAMPHVGRHLPPEVRDGLTDLGRQVLDTDWHVDRLYGFLEGGDVTTLIATHSRTVADLNRSPENEALYPGRFETGLTPLADFEGRPLYRDGYEPDPTDIARRVERWWRPYHAELAKLIQLARERHGHALLLDAHSIRAEIPQLFEGRLPDINVGTNDGQSCDPRLTAAVVEVLRGQDRFTWVVDGRFKGGWTTRHYGRPGEGVHAIQFELAQAAYMDEANPTVFDAQRAAPMMELLEKLVTAIRSFDP